MSDHITKSADVLQTLASGGLRTGIRGALAIVAAAAALIVASPASAGLGVPATASCQFGYIVAHPPTMTAATNQIMVGSTLISNPLQPVGYKAHLFRATSSGWTRVMSGPLLKQQVRTFAEGQTAWLDTSSGQWVQGWTKFPIQFAGVHRIAVEYFWYPFPGTNFGGDYAYLWVADHYDLRRNPYYLSSQPTCAY